MSSIAQVHVFMLRGRAIYVSMPKRFKDVLDWSGGSGVPFRPIFPTVAEKQTLLDHLEPDTVKLERSTVKGPKTRKYIGEWRKNSS